MKTLPASKLNYCPIELNGAHQSRHVRFQTSSTFKLTDGKKTGWGALCRFEPDSDIDVNAAYVGGLHQCDAQGQGQLHVKEDNFSYIGGWRDNVASGWGKWCDSWTEDWPDGVMRYKQVTRVPKTLRYEGGFKDGYFHGHGEFNWEDGANYKGSWKEGRRDGCGVYTTKEGNARYYWNATLPDSCESDNSDSFKSEYRLRLAADKKVKDVEAKLKEMTTKYEAERKKRIDTENKLEKKQEALDKETDMYLQEHIDNKIAQAQIKIMEEEHQIHPSGFHLF